MKAVTTEQIRALDRRTIEAGITGELLMDRAGYAVARSTIEWLKRRDSRAVLLFAGKGNNGGDAFVAARHLAAAGCEPVLVLLGGRAEIAGDAKTHFERMVGVRVVGWDGAELPGDVVVDGLLGTGLTGEVREPYGAAIRWINQSRRPVVAIDIPSGLDSDTGEAHGVGVRADVTVTMGLPKIGLLRPAAMDYVGALEVADIGFPPEFVNEIRTDVELITAADVRGLIPRRARSAHKGTFGHLLVVAGSEGYTGAPVICAHAAARSGAGLVTLAVPRAIYPIVAAHCPPEIMPRPLERLEYSSYDAIAVGPGIGRGEEVRRWLIPLVREAGRPLVLDADALVMLGEDVSSLRGARAVLTPHPGEMGRLTGMSAKEIQAARWEAARAFARQHDITLVLKGAGTVVTDCAGKLHVNLAGNPGMARGGMGDALTGIVGALLGQGLAPLDAARAGAYLHARAGDLAAAQHGEVAMLVTDVIANLGGAFGELESQPVRAARRE